MTINNKKLITQVLAPSCPKCGQIIISPDYSFCTRCGFKFIGNMFLLEINKENSIYKKLCQIYERFIISDDNYFRLISENSRSTLMGDIGEASVDAIVRHIQDWYVTDNKDRHYFQLISRIACDSFTGAGNIAIDVLRETYVSDIKLTAINENNDALRLFFGRFIIIGYLVWMAEYLNDKKLIPIANEVELEKFSNDFNKLKSFVRNDYYDLLEGQIESNLITREVAIAILTFVKLHYMEILNSFCNSKKLELIYSDISKICEEFLVAGYTLALVDAKYR